MTFPQQAALTNLVALRPPSRDNRFTVLAAASLGKEEWLLQQTKYACGRGIRADLEAWQHTLASEDIDFRDSHLVPVKGTYTLPLPSHICPDFVPVAFRPCNTHDRRIFVTRYFSRGTLRDCLDRGEPLSRTGDQLNSGQAKLTILMDVAVALRTIEEHLPGGHHGALSSSAIFLDKNGRAFVSWHQYGSTLEDYASGARECRWFSPAVLQQLQGILHGCGPHDTTKISLSHDDMYAFGVLAWEIATEELPFEECELCLPEHLLHRIDTRFRQKAPEPLQVIIEQCLQANLEQRPSWDTLLSQLDALDPAVLAASASNGSSSSNDASPYISTETPTSTCPDCVKSADKSKVVEMMESVLSSTFYKRELPAHLPGLTSHEGKRLFREMIIAGTAECFFQLCTSFNTQSDPAFCGVSSLSMVLNALEIDPRRQWRGVWRWYSDEALDCCASIEVMKQKGITFNQFACLARCHSKVAVKRADRHTLDEFRRDIQMVCRGDGVQMVLSFSRAALGQTGSGHFSPVGGYHAGEDKVLVLDTARFKYPPFFASVAELWQSLLPEDPETGLCRGYFLISATARQKQDIQRKKLLNIHDPDSSAASTASSSSVSLPSLAGLSRSASPIPEEDLPVGENMDFVPVLLEKGDPAECDCDCPVSKTIS